jgi:hypothetical protein
MSFKPMKSFNKSKNQFDEQELGWKISYTVFPSHFFKYFFYAFLQL